MDSEGIISQRSSIGTAACPIRYIDVYANELEGNSILYTGLWE